jgi:tetratricopeptide (TPR) repeat protein
MANETLDDLRQQAQQALAQGQYPKARQLYHQALGAHGDHPDTHYGLATVCFLLNDLDGAVYHFTQVTRLDPVRAGAFVNLGAVYNRLEKFDDAIAALRKGIHLDPNRAEGYYNLGVVYRHLGKPDMALQAYREATRINPRMPDAHYNIANIYLEKNQLGIAIAHYQQALELRPNWEKAVRGLEAARAQQNPDSAVTADTVTVETPSARVRRLDPDRLVDPNAHGELLREAHQAIIEADKQGHQLLAIIESDVEKVIRDLSNCLLFPKDPRNDLHAQIQKFDGVMTQLRQMQATLKKKTQQIREASDGLNQA